MPVAFVQNISNSGSSVGNFDLVFSGSVTIGNLIVVIVGTAQPSVGSSIISSSSNISDTLGNVYIANYRNGSGQHSLWYFYAVSVGSGSNTVSIVFNSASIDNDYAACATEYSGINSNTETITSDGNGTSTMQGNLSSATSAVYVAASQSLNSQTVNFTAPAGFTQRAAFSGGFLAVPFMYADFIGTGAQGADFTLDNTNDFISVGQVFEFIPPTSPYLDAMIMFW